MADVIMKVFVTQFLRKEPKFLPPSFIDPGDGNGSLRVIAGEKVKTGAKPDVDEATGGKTFRWVFVEAIEGNDPEKRKGFVSSEFLVSEETSVAEPGVAQPFAANVEKAVFADACVMQAELNATNPAYLYALAFAQSGEQWTATEVKTSDADDAAAFGVYQFTQETWQELLKLAELSDFTPDQIKFPTRQCVVAAVLASKSASLLKGLITDRGVSAVDLYLAHMFADDKSFGSNAAVAILDAEKANASQPSEEVIGAKIYPDENVRKAFLSRNQAIFKADGSATIAAALQAAADKFVKGFDAVRQLAHDIEASLPEDPTSPVEEGETGALGGEIQARPGKFKDVVNKIIAGAKSHGLDPMTALVFVAIESDFDPTQCAHSSSAAGLYQFIDSTWKAAGGPTFPGRGGKGNGQAAGASVDLQVEIGSKFIAENLHTLTASLDRTPTGVELYMAHQQGIGGAIKILKADPDAAIEDIIGTDAARNNAFGGLTVRQTINKFNAIYKDNEKQAAALVTVSAKIEAFGVIKAGPVLARAVQFALAEMNQFALKDGAVVVETRQPLKNRVLEYFRFVHRGDITNPASEPWSAAFISFVMSNAGMNDFPFSAGHAIYILKGLTNRLANKMDAPVVYFDKNEMAPRVGDLIGFSNDSSVRNRADLEARLLLPPNKQFFASHTDLVVEVSSGKVKAVGGNVSQSIKVTAVKTGDDGMIDSANKRFFLLRLNT